MTKYIHSPTNSNTFVHANSGISTELMLSLTKATELDLKAHITN